MRIKGWGDIATKWLNINNRGCNPRLLNDLARSATKWLNRIMHNSTPSGLTLSCHCQPWVAPTVIKVTPFQGFAKI